MTDNNDWMARALCAGANVDLWFGEYLIDDTDDVSGQRQRNAKAFAAAKKICRQCPVSLNCYELAETNGERCGVWGGVTFGKTSSRNADLEIMRRIWTERGDQPTAPQLAPVISITRTRDRCGTEPGYAQHRRKGEPTCQACKDAKAAAARRRKQEQTQAAARERAWEAWA